MSLPSNTARVLITAGFIPHQDFIVTMSGQDVSLDWISSTERPSDETIAAWADGSQAMPNGELFSVKMAKDQLSKLRYEKEVSGFTIGTQFISSHRDEIGHWYPRFASAFGFISNDAAAIAANPTGQYPYKPRGGEPVVLTASQVVRAYECLAWYINSCFAVEVQAVAMLTAGMTIEQVLAAIQWPQTTFTWERPE
jgi:hypothetical protein